MDNRSIRSLAKSRLSSNWGAAIGIMLVMAIVQAVGGGLQSALVPVAAPTLLTDIVERGDMAALALALGQRTSLSTLVGLIFSLIVGMMGVGVSWGYIHMIDSGDLQFESMTWAFSKLGTVILFNLWTFLWMSLWSLPLGIVVIIQGLAAASGNSTLSNVGFLLVFPTSILIIVKGLQYSQGIHILYDNPDMGPRALLRESIEQMRGQGIRYILLFLPYVLPLILTGILMVAFIIMGINGFVDVTSIQSGSGNGLMVLGIIGAMGSLIALIVLSFVLGPRVASAQAAFYIQCIRREPIPRDFNDYRDKEAYRPQDQILEASPDDYEGRSDQDEFAENTAPLSHIPPDEGEDH